MKNKYLKGIVFASVALGLSFQTQAQDKTEVEQIRSKYDLTKLQRMKGNFQKKAKNEKAEAIQLAKQKGWKTKFTAKDGSLLELQRVVNGKPIYYTTSNAAAAKSTRTNHLNSGGSLGLNLMGQGMTAYVWDGGLARASHQEYDGAGGTNRFSVYDGSTTLNYHAAHVTGTIMASGVQPEAKGMAPHSKVRGSDWNNDKSEAISAAQSGMLVSNHSYGYATRNQQGQVQLPQNYFGGYIDESRAWDEILFNAPNYLMVVAAGNDGSDNSANNNPTGGYGFDKLTGHSTSKNNLVVANAQDANIDSNGNLVSVSINSSSSEGPTDDFRIKPDITGNGTNVYSTYDSSNTAYNSITGTSMASPNVTGSLLLLQQHHKNLNNGAFMRGATLKGLALHTADDAGVSGPDAVFGWGLLHTKKAAEAISNKGNTSKIEELTLTSGQTYTITVDSDGVNPLLASISWTDRPGTATSSVNSTTPVLVNDLDIRVSKNGTTFLPYELTGATTNTRRDNNVDPFERIDVNGASGTYTITVSNKGSLVGGSQDYTLIVTGITGAPVVCNATVPTGVSTTGVTSSEATVNWAEVSGASYDVRYRATSTSSWSTSAIATTTATLSGLAASTQYEVQVRSKCSSGNSNYSNSVNFTTPAITISYCNSKGASVADEYIQKVELGSISNTSTGGNGYSDFTSISTSLLKGEDNTITITPRWTSTTYNEGYGVFIDYNQDGDFSDAGEVVYTKTPSKTTLVVGSFTVPAGATEGATRMRIVLKYDATPTACEASFQYGEVEDYTVVIESAQADTTAPTAPTNLSASNVEQTTLSLNWSASTDNVAVTEYDIYQGASLLGSTANTSVNITGLTAATAYTFSVRAKDEAGNVSSASNINVTTLSNQVTYCDSKGNRSTYEWIDNVELGGMTNATGQNSGYGDFTSKVATLGQGTSNQMIVSAGFSGTAYTEHWAVWIDFNQDGTFADSEKVVSGSSSSSNNLTATVAVPSNAILGQTRMRVSMKYNAAQTSCETFADGEVEDYTVNITASSSSLNLTYSDTNADVLGNEANTNLTAYPNPAVNNIQVKLSSRADNMTYRIVNVIGSVVKRGKLDSNNINVSNLETGMYILEVNDGQKTLKTKILKK